MAERDDDSAVLDIVSELQREYLKLEALKASPASALNKRALSIAMTELETAMLWVANARQ